MFSFFFLFYYPFFFLFPPSFAVQNIFVIFLSVLLFDVSPPWNLLIFPPSSFTFFFPYFYHYSLFYHYSGILHIHLKCLKCAISSFPLSLFHLLKYGYLSLLFFPQSLHISLSFLISLFTAFPSLCSPLTTPHPTHHHTTPHPTHHHQTSTLNITPVQSTCSFAPPLAPPWGQSPSWPAPFRLQRPSADWGHDVGLPGKVSALPCARLSPAGPPSWIRTALVDQIIPTNKWTNNTK